MNSFWEGLILVLIPLFILFQIVNDVVFDKDRFLSFSENLSFKYKFFYTILSFVFLLFLWFWVSKALDRPDFLPTPRDTFQAFIDLVSSGVLLSNTLVSLKRIGFGFGLASIIGVSIGSLAGTFARFEAIFLPINSIFRYIPPTAFIGLTIIWFGIDELSKVALIFLGVIFYIVQMTFDIFKLVPKIYIEAAQTLGANRWEIFRKVILSISIPDVLAVLRVNLGAAWTFLIVAEVVAAQQGLGYLMSISQRFLQTPQLFALIFFVGFLGFTTDSLLSVVIKFYSGWR